MAGVKGRSGGARAGAGRKTKETVVEQAHRREVILQVIGDPEWRDLLVSWLAMAKTTPSVIYPILPYLLGGAKQEIDVNARVEHVRITEIRQALGMTEIGPRALPEPRKASGA